MTTDRRPPPPVIAGGTRIGRYAVGGELDRGVRGVVHRAVDTAIERPVALEVIARPAAGSQPAEHQAYARFLGRARAAGRLQHPNVVKVYDVGEDETLGVAYIAFELVEGETLDRVLARGRQLPPAEVQSIDWQVAAALQAARDQGIADPAIDPANVILAADGSVKVMGFDPGTPTPAPASPADPTAPVDPAPIAGRRRRLALATLATASLLAVATWQESRSAATERVPHRQALFAAVAPPAAVAPKSEMAPPPPPPAAMTSPFPYVVRVAHQHRLGHCRGRLRIDREAIVYDARARDRDDRVWRYDTLTAFQLRGNELVLVSTERDALSLGLRHRRWVFRLQEELPAAAARHLAARVDR